MDALIRASLEVFPYIVQRTLLIWNREHYFVMLSHSQVLSERTPKPTCR
jgi:hypothetical protein